MSPPLIVGAALVFLALGYRTFGSWVARRFDLDPHAVTPAVRHDDGADFVPTRPAYLFGQRISAIAAAGPIAGPILAGQQFGWLAALLWIAAGAVLIGAVHDFATLVASVRHDARLIAEVIRAQLGRRAGVAMTPFIWITLVYVIVAFADITASTFVAGDEALATERGFDPAGAVATSAVL
jgi:carbon starvation protein